MRPRTDYIISKDEVYGYANHWLTVALKTSTGLTGTGLTGGFAGTHGGEASRGHSAITGAFTQLSISSILSGYARARFSE